MKMNVIRNFDVSNIDQHELEIHGHIPKLFHIGPMFLSIMHTFREKIIDNFNFSPCSVDDAFDFSDSINNKIDIFRKAEYENIVNFVNDCIICYCRGKISNDKYPESSEFIIDFTDKWLSTDSFPMSSSLETQFEQMMKENSSFDVLDFIEDLYKFSLFFKTDHNYGLLKTNENLIDLIMTSDDQEDETIFNLYKDIEVNYYSIIDHSSAVTRSTIETQIEVILHDNMGEDKYLPFYIESTLIREHGQLVAEFILKEREVENADNEWIVSYKFSDKVISYLEEENPNSLDCLAHVLNDNYSGKTGISAKFKDFIIKLTMEDLKLTQRELYQHEREYLKQDLCENFPVAYGFEILSKYVRKIIC